MYSFVLKVLISLFHAKKLIRKILNHPYKSGGNTLKYPILLSYIIYEEQKPLIFVISAMFFTIDNIFSRLTQL